MSTEIDRLNAEFEADQQRAREAHAARVADTTARLLAEAAAAAAAELKALPTSEAAVGLVAVAIDGADARFTCTNKRGKVRAVTVMTPSARIDAAEYREVLNVGGMKALDILRSDGLNGLAEFWRVRHCKAFNNIKFGALFHALESLNGRGDTMTENARDHLEPIYRLLRRRKELGGLDD